MAAPVIQGTVSREGRPLGGAYIRLSGPSGEFVSEQYTKDDGRFTFHVAEGRWTIEARAAGTQPVVEIVAAAAGETPVSIDLPPA